MSAEEMLHDLSDRIDGAIQSLADLREGHEYGTEGYKRLTAKIEGVALAGSYLDGYLRLLPSDGVQ